mmetsp:Transcript_24509/g.56484  ORF Transcript_24509/g.56484 Transcript_24509/m.56484 type:complete len:202 (+) Transcript_24509:1604-2209(+)
MRHPSHRLPFRNTQIPFQDLYPKDLAGPYHFQSLSPKVQVQHLCPKVLVSLCNLLGLCPTCHHPCPKGQVHLYPKVPEHLCPKVLAGTCCVHPSPKALVHLCPTGLAGPCSLRHLYPKGLGGRHSPFQEALPIEGASHMVTPNHLQVSSCLREVVEEGPCPCHLASVPSSLLVARASQAPRAATKQEVSNCTAIPDEGCCP